MPDTRNNVNILNTKPETKPYRRQPPAAATARRQVWQPEPIGLTREELRAIVADMLG